MSDGSDLFNHLDRSALTMAALHDPPLDIAYGHARTPEERLAFVEHLRQVNYGYDPFRTGMARVIEVVQRHRP